MMHLRRQVLGCALVVCLFLCFFAGESALASTPPTLRFDPFRARPEVVAKRSASRSDGADRAFRPVLVSTVVGGRRATANLGGEILSIGESTKGYRLIEVRPFEAIFEKDGKRLRLEVEGQEREGQR